jgi:hypothetical protein
MDKASLRGKKKAITLNLIFCIHKWSIITYYLCYYSFSYKLYPLIIIIIIIILCRQKFLSFFFLDPKKMGSFENSTNFYDIKIIIKNKGHF